MSSPWDNVEHVATVLEYSKTLVHLAVQGGAVTIGGNFVLNAAKYCFDHEGPLRGIIEHWQQILETLTDEQKAILETSSPGIVKQMDKNLAMLKQRLSFLALTLQKKTYFGIVLPWTESANCVKDVKMLFDEVDRDFTHTTRHVLRDNPVQLILTANDAVSHPVNVELSDLAVPARHVRWISTFRGNC